MAKLVLRSCFVEINGVDLSNACEQVEVTFQKNKEDATTFGNGGGESSVHGLKTDSIQVTLHQSFAGGEVHATLKPLYENETEFPVVIRPTSAAVSATNPEWQADCKLFNLPAVNGGPGNLSKVQVTLEPQDSGITEVLS